MHMLARAAIVSLPPVGKDGRRGAPLHFGRGHCRQELQAVNTSIKVMIAGSVGIKSGWGPVHVQFFELERRMDLLLGLVLLHGVELSRVLEQVEVVPQAVVELCKCYPVAECMRATLDTGACQSVQHLRLPSTTGFKLFVAST